jgi:type I restriction enzyme S subunit
MIMQDNEKKPALRFKGFTDPWEQRKLSELTSMHARIGWQNLRTSEFLDSGDYMLITGTDFDDGTVNYSTCHFVERERYEQDKNIQIRNGSILITKDGTLGKVAYVQGLSMPATLNAGVFNVEIRNTSIVDERYLFQYLKAPFLMDYVDKKATGGTIKHLNQNILVDFPVVMPKKTEQVSIGNFFQIIDTLITLHQRKYEKLVNIKKSMLDKMFPQNGASVPEIRFKGFTDPWEQRKFGEVVDKYEDPVETPHDGYYRLGIRSHAKGTFHSYVEKGHELETAQMYRVAAGNFIVNITFGWEHAVAITNESDAGKLVSHRFPQYSFHDDMLPEFFKYVIADEDFRHWLWLASPGGAGRNRVLKLDEMLNYEMVLPSKEEQQRIAAIFCNLDTLITLHQRKLEKLQNIKKSCLEKMFV